MQKRVVRVISIEGNPDWVDRVLEQDVPVGYPATFHRKGTIKELQRVELKDGERMRVVVERDE